MTTVGITIRRRNRSDGIDPLRTHSYAVDREIPRRCAACSTERVSGEAQLLSSISIRVLRRDGMSQVSAWDVLDYVLVSAIR